MPILSSYRAMQDTQRDATELRPEHLEGFRHCQRLAYECVQAVEHELHVGMTEKQAVARMEAWLAARGVREFFHKPYAWFGDRTAFTRFVTDVQFFPTSRKLEPNMPVILDVAPAVDGHVADVGYACMFGHSALHEQMLDDLEPYRELILQGVRARKNLSEVYRDVDRLIERQGYENRHRRYPARVLAHRVNLIPAEARSSLTVARFGAPALGYLLGRLQLARRGAEHHSPLWNDSRFCDHPADPGLWAVEPHLGFRGVGVKWEEILVVTENDAFWLDDELPHVQRWKRRKSSQGKAQSKQSGHEVRA